jgi:TPR repeat protein
MKEPLIFLLLILISLTFFGQDAAELNEQSKIFIETQEFDKAFSVLKQAAELGNAESQYNLGYFFQSGISVDKNLEKAVEWYLKSANQDWNDALYAMMMAYGSGSGVQQDSNKAFYFALKCAETEDSTCMYNVMMCYNEGRGIEKSSDKTVVWAIRVGKLENPEDIRKSGYITYARLLLAYMYRDGINVEQNNFKSYQWFMIFNEFKKDLSFLEQEQIVKGIQNLMENLTAFEIENGQQEAEKIIGRPLRNLENFHKAEM